MSRLYALWKGWVRPGVVEAGVSSAETSAPLSSTSDAPEVSLWRRFFNLRTLISFLIAAAILAFAISRLEVDRGAIWANIRGSNPLLLAVAFVLFYLTFPLRAWRWRLLLENAGFNAESGVVLPSSKGLSEIVMLGWFANCIVPAKLGDAYRGYLLKKNAGVSFSRTVGTILAERIADMVVLCVLLLVAGAGIVGNLRSDNSMSVIYIGITGVGVVVLMGAGLLAMYHFGARLRRLLPARLQDKYHGFQEGTLQSLRRKLPLLGGVTVSIWLLEAGRLLLVTHSLDLSLTLSLVLFVALANSLLTALPFTPGGLGLVEAGIIGLLMISLDSRDAVAVAILDRAISYWSLVFVGLIVFIFSRRK